MALCRIVAVEIDRSVGKGLGLTRADGLQPAVQQLHHLRVALRGAGDVDVPHSVTQQAHGVAPDPVPVLRHHVLPPKVPAEGPGAQDLQRIVAGDGLLLLLLLLQNLFGTPVRQQAVGALPQRLAPGGLHLQILRFQATSLAELPLEPAHDLHVHICQLTLVDHLGVVQRLIPDLPARDLDEAMLVVKAPVDWVGPELQSLPHRLGLRILLVADVGLGARGLGVGPVLDLRLRGPAGHDLVGLLPVGSLPTVPHIDGHAGLLHVLGFRPSTLVLLRLVLEPLLLAHLRHACRLLSPAVLTHHLGLAGQRGHVLALLHLHLLGLHHGRLHRLHHADDSTRC
mmetsp:Transcript_47304/g.112421  ORF Transcript_47304/g.112421 Transcript_47304/m.112421 type:complete len:340 (+) Transcript_47304:570-1589(+)